MPDSEALRELERKDFTGLAGMIVSEVVFILVAFLAGLFEAWGLFAAMSLLCVLTPLWLLTVTQVVALRRALAEEG